MREKVGKRKCPWCDSSDRNWRRTEIVDVPEVLFLHHSRGNKDTAKGKAWQDIPLKETLNLRSLTADNTPLEYELMGVCALDAPTFLGFAGHVISLVQGPNERWYLVDGQRIESNYIRRWIQDETQDMREDTGELLTWQHFDSMQRDPRKKVYRALPEIFVYKRMTPTPPTEEAEGSLVPRKRKWGYEDDDYEERELSLAEIGNLRIHDSVETIHERMPDVAIRDAYNALVEADQNAEDAIKMLQARPSINLGFTEKVGDANIEVRFDITPSEGPPRKWGRKAKMLLRSQEISGKCTYEVSGQTFEGTFTGRTTRKRDV